jgi:D-alanine-D-alanine ligase
MRIAVVHEALAESARPDESDALVQLELVERELRGAGHACTRIALDLDLDRARDALRALGPDLAFNLVESLGGHGRLAHLVPALLEALGIPCTGAPAAAMLETTDKLLAKRRLTAAGLPTPPWLESPRALGRTSEPSGRWIVKPVAEDASLDIDDAAVVDGVATARSALAAAARPSFAERYVSGREFNLSLLEKERDAELLPAAEVCFHDWPERKPRIVGYDAKWKAGSREFVDTRRRFDFDAGDAPILARLAELAHACWRLFALRGWARIDFRVDHDGEPWILEVNANPCLSPDAGFCAAAERAGLSPAEVVGRIVSAATAGASL